MSGLWREWSQVLRKWIQKAWTRRWRSFVEEKNRNGVKDLKKYGVTRNF